MYQIWNCATMPRQMAAGGKNTALTLLGSMILILGVLTGCMAGNPAHTAPITSTPAITVAMTQTPPAAMNPGDTATVAATVSNDSSKAGVDWLVSCSAGTCGTFGASQSLTIHTASGATTTYNAPANTPGGAVTIYARSTANGAVTATQTVTVSGNLAIIFPDGNSQIPTTIAAGSSPFPVEATLSASFSSAVALDYKLSCGSTSVGACGYIGQRGFDDWGVSYTSSFNNNPVYYYPPAQAPPLNVTIKVTISGYSGLSASTSFAIQPLVNTSPVTVALTGPDGYSFPSAISAGVAMMAGANVANDTTSAGVDWSVSCNSSDCGTLSSTHSASNSTMSWGSFTGPLSAGVAYTAPATPPSGGTVTLIATSTAAPTVKAQNILTIRPANSLSYNGQLEGQFVFELHGRDTAYDTLSPNYGANYAIVGAMIGDGQGSVSTSEKDIMDFNLGTSAESASGTYTMSSAGHGQISLGTYAKTLYNGGGRVVLDVDFINSNEAILTEVDGVGTGSGKLYRQNLSDLATAISPTGLPLNGNYTLSLNGAVRDDPTQPIHLAGTLAATAAASGQSTETSLVADASYPGVVATKASATTHPTLGSTYDAYGRTSLGTPDLGATVFKNGNSSLQALNAYILDKSHYLLIQNSDSYTVLSGSLVAQPSSASLSGAYVFTASGATAAGAAQSAGGVLQCGSTGTVDVTPLAGTPLAKQSVQVKCTSPASDGRGLINITGASGGISNFAAYPTADIGWQLVEIDSNGPSGAGVALAQSASSIAASTFSGSYATGLLLTNGTGPESVSGSVSSDGASALSGSASLSQMTLASKTTNAVTKNVAVTGSYSADASGRFTGSLNLATSPAQSLGAVFYVADASHVLVQTTDAASPGAGLMRAQNLSLTLTMPSLIMAQSGVAYNSGSTIVINGGSLPYTVSATSLPPGLSIANTGVISGTPTAEGAYNISVTVTDAASNTSTASTLIAVEAANGVTMQFANDSANSVLPPTPYTIMNSTLTLGAIAGGDYSGEGVDWSLSCTLNGVAQDPGDTSTCGYFSSTYTAAAHTSSYVNGGQKATVIYNAPGTAGTVVTITAASTAFPARTVSAQTMLLTQQPTVTLSGGTGFLMKGKSVAIGASVPGDPFSEGVTWSLTCGGNLAGNCGVLSATQSGDGVMILYTAPSSAPASNAGTVTLTATSVFMSANSMVNASLQENITIGSSATSTNWLSGNFIVNAQGQDNVGNFFGLAGSITGDGNGNITSGNLLGAASAVDYSQGIWLTNPVTGSYTAGSDGRGTLTLSTANFANSFGPIGNGDSELTFNLAFTTPTHAVISENDGFGNITGTMDTQDPVALVSMVNGTTGLNGVYTLAVSGALDSATTYSASAATTTNYYNKFYVNSALTFSFDPSTQIVTETGALGDMSYAGVVTADQATTSTSTFSMGTSGVYEASALLLGPDNSDTVKIFPIDAEHFAVIGYIPDNSSIFTGTLTAQPTTPTLSRSYSFTENGYQYASGSPSAPLAIGGVFTCDNTTQGPVDINIAGTTTKSMVTANCSAVSNGRATITFTGTSATGVQQYAAYPTIDNNFQLIELDGGSAGTGPAGSGIAYQQTGAAMANFTGSYAMIFADHGQVNDTNWSGILQSNGSSISSATVDADQLSIASLQNVSSNYAIFTQDADATLTGVGLTDQGSGRFSGSLTGTINGSAITVNGEFYMIDSGNLLFLETDANTPGAGTLKLQQLQ